MGIYHNGPDGESIENLHHKDDRDGAESAASVYPEQERGKLLVCITFILEVLILAALVVLEYFLRWTTVFPMRKVNFTCSDPELLHTEDDPSLSSFDFNAVVPTKVIYSLCLCVPPFVILIGEVAVWAFTEDNQKSIRVCCKSFNVPQIFRRLIRFVGVFIFGFVTMMIFVDVIKLMVGRLRPNFLDLCKVNQTLCTSNGNVGGDELCTNTDSLQLRHARQSFPSLNSAMTAYAAVYISIYIHGALRTRSVRVLRPFLSLAFMMLAMLCGLREIGLNHNFWTDVVVGWGLGIAMAFYLGSVVLYRFREYVSERKMIQLLHGFLVDHQLLNEITRDEDLVYNSIPWERKVVSRNSLNKLQSLIRDDTLRLCLKGKLRLFPFPFHIPRAHTRHSTPDQRFEGIKTNNPPLSVYGEMESNNNRYRDRPVPSPGYPEEHGLAHL